MLTRASGDAGAARLGDGMGCEAAWLEVDVRRLRNREHEAAPAVSRVYWRRGVRKVRVRVGRGRDRAAVEQEFK